MSALGRKTWLTVMAAGLAIPAAGWAQPPRLQGDLAEEVAEQEARIDTALWQEETDEASLHEWTRVADEIAGLRRKYQGERWWETIDAEQRVADLRLRLSFDAVQREKLAELQELERQVVELYEAGRYEEAIALAHRESDSYRRLFGENHPSYAASLDDIALLYVSAGQAGEAEPPIHDALRIRNHIQGEHHPAYAEGLHDLASLYVHQRRHPEAAPHYEDALAIKKRALGKDHPAYAKTLYALARVYVHMGRYAEAKALLYQALRTWREFGADHPSYATSLGNLVLVYGAMGNRGSVAKLARRAVEARWRSLTRNFAALSQAQKQQLLADEGALLATDIVWSLVFNEEKLAPEAGLHVALLMKQILFEAARQETAALRKVIAAASPRWQAAFGILQQLRRRYAALALESMADAVQPEQDELLDETTESADALADRIDQLEQYVRGQSANPAYAKLLRLTRIEIPQARAALRPGEALVEYVRYRRYDFDALGWDVEHYGAFVLRRSGRVGAVDLGEAKVIDDAVRRFRSEADAAIERGKSVALGRKDEKALAQLSSELRSLAWEPLRAHLKEVKRVYLGPEGDLGLLPFEALAEDPSGRRYLAEDYELVYVGTGRDLGRLALTSGQRPNSKATAVLIGNPAFDVEPRELAKVVAGLTPTRDSSPRPCKWPPYEDGEKLVIEAGEQLQELGWSVPPVLTKERAVEEAVYTLRGPRILQFATHGELRKPHGESQVGWRNPLLHSTLLLAGACSWRKTSSVFYRVGDEVLTEAQGRERGLSDTALEAGRIDLADGRLTAYEVTGLDLDGTELVNMTACETGLGETTPEGIVGLRHAFLLAGARSLTMSMWEVPIDETTRQIEDFYRRWIGGEVTIAASRYAAFRAAQLAALERARDTYSGAGHPFYWAGIVFVGDPGDLPRRPK